MIFGLNLSLKFRPRFRAKCFSKLGGCYQGRGLIWPIIETLSCSKWELGSRFTPITLILKDRYSKSSVCPKRLTGISRPHPQTNTHSGALLTWNPASQCLYRHSVSSYGITKNEYKLETALSPQSSICRWLFSILCRKLWFGVLDFLVWGGRAFNTVWSNSLPFLALFRYETGSLSKPCCCRGPVGLDWHFLNGISTFFFFCKINKNPLQNIALSITAWNAWADPFTYDRLFLNKVDLRLWDGCQLSHEVTDCNNDVSESGKL